jgi:hypothetical protein
MAAGYHAAIPGQAQVEDPITGPLFSAGGEQGPNLWGGWRWLEMFWSTVPRLGVYLTVNLRISLSERIQYVLKHGFGWFGASIRNGLTHSGDDLFHHLSILHAQIAGKLLLDRQLDILRD